MGKKHKGKKSKLALDATLRGGDGPHEDKRTKRTRTRQAELAMWLDEAADLDFDGVDEDGWAAVEGYR